MSKPFPVSTLLLTSLAVLLVGCSRKSSEITVPPPSAHVASLDGQALMDAGKQQFLKLPCKGCHEFQGQGGRRGPKLDHVGDHDYAWQYRHLTDPKSVNPKSGMPSFAQLPVEDRELLAKWLASLK